MSELPRRRSALLAPLLAWLLVGGALLVRERVYGTGLYGWVGDWLLRHRGEFDTDLPMAPGLVLLFAPALLYIRWAGERAGPDSGWPRLGRFGATWHWPTPAPAPAGSRTHRERLRRAGWWMLLAAAVVAVGGVAGWAALTLRGAPRAAATVPLSALSADVVASAEDPSDDVVVRDGVLLPDRAWSYRESSPHDGPDGSRVRRYVPVVPAGWRLDEPVHLVVAGRGPGDWDFLPTREGGYRGRLARGPLPTWVRRGLEDRGVVLGRRLWVLTSAREVGFGPGADRRGAALALLASGLVAGVTLGALGALTLLGLKPAPPATEPGRGPAAGREGR